TVLPAALGKTSNSGAPKNGSMLQSALALAVVIGFAIAGFNHELGDLVPVITLFNWLCNSAAVGLILLLALSSVSMMTCVIGNTHGRNVWVRIIAPGIAAVGLTAVFLMILVNFDLMIEAEKNSALIYIMPGIIIGAGIVGLIWGQIIQTRRPSSFAQMREQDQFTETQEIAIAQGNLDEHGNVLTEDTES